MFSWWRSVTRSRFRDTVQRRPRRSLLRIESLEERVNPVLYYTADLAITQAATPQVNVAPGQEASFVLTITNNGPNAVGSFNVINRTSADLLNPTFTPSSGTYDPNTGRFTLPTPLAQGESVTLTVSGTASQDIARSLVNVAMVAPPGGVFDPNLLNNTTAPIILPINTNVADLSIIKTSDADNTLLPGDEVTYTIIVSNDGPRAVTGARVQDTFPAGLTNVEWTAVASAGSSVAAAAGTGNIDTTVNLLNDGTVTFTITATVPEDFSGAVSNTATVTVPDGFFDPNLGNNTSTDDLTVLAVADLAVTKTSEGDTRIVGETVVYTVTVTNNGPFAVTGATITDLAPDLLTDVTWEAVASEGSSVAADSGSGGISTTMNLLNGGTVVFTITGTVATAAEADDTIVNTATVFVPVGWHDPDLDNNLVVDTITVTASGDLAIVKTSDAENNAVPAGEQVIYTIVVSNTGNDTATSVRVEDVIPEGLTGVTWVAVASDGSSVDGDDEGDGDIDTLVTLAPGGTVTFTITATAGAEFSGAVENTATLTVPSGFTDTNPDNNSSTHELSVLAVADLAVTKTAEGDTTIAGATVVYTVTVTNNGPFAVTGATIIDQAPAGLINVFWTAEASAGSSVADEDGNDDINTTMDLLNGGTVTFTITGIVASTVVADDAIVNTATVFVPVGWYDPDLDNNLDVHTTTVTASGDLAIVKSSAVNGDEEAEEAEPGDTITYTIVVSNTGNDTATDVRVQDVIPEGLTGVAWVAVASNGSSVQDEDGEDDIDTFVTLAPGGFVTFTITATVSMDAVPDSTIENTAELTVPTGFTDTDGTNNSATDEVFILGLDA